MRKFIKSNLNLVVLIITICSVTSCSDDENLNDLDETIFVRHRNADMPAYIKGNASEKVFLITLNGGPGGVGLEFRGKAFNEIENQYGVVYFDQRGSGNAQGNYNGDGVNIDIMAEDVLALAKVMKRKFGNDTRLFLLGQSWGGALGINALVKDQSDFKGWIDVDGAYNAAGLYDLYLETFPTFANTQIALGNSVEYWESVLEIVSQVDPMNNVSDFSILNRKAPQAEAILANDGIINPENTGTGNSSLNFRYNPRINTWNGIQIGSIITGNQGFFQTIDLTSQLSKITIPSLFISGKYDMVVPIASAQTAFETIGSEFKELLIFERSGHSPPFSEPEKFAQEVLRFINTHK